MTEQELMDMELHEVTEAFSGTGSITVVIRVIGGWVYNTATNNLHATSVFVPEPKGDKNDR